MIIRPAELLLILVCSIAARLGAAPLPPQAPVDVMGTIGEAKWFPEKRVPAASTRASGSLGHDRVFPAHFLVTLEDYDGISSATAQRLSARVDTQSTSTKTGDTLLLMLNSPDKELLKPGMRVRVRDYTVSGDEGGTWAKHGPIDIMAKSSAFGSTQQSPGP